MFTKVRHQQLVDIQITSIVDLHGLDVFFVAMFVQSGFLSCCHYLRFGHPKPFLDTCGARTACRRRIGQPVHALLVDGRPYSARP